MKIDEFFDREAYPISHGNWESRWKISITNGKVRWTVKTDKGIKDLDSQLDLTENIYYNVTARYDGANFDIYINGQLDNHTTFSGSILTTDIALTIGQVLPDNQAYNFKGVLDDIRIYNYALSVDEIQNIYNEASSAVQQPGTGLKPDKFLLEQNYPNPFNRSTIIKYQLHEPAHIQIDIYNTLGKKVKTLLSSYKQTGFYSISWNGENDNGGINASGVYVYQMKISGKFCDRKKLLLLK
jgi:hypothetical protein